MALKIPKDIQTALDNDLVWVFSSPNKTDRILVFAVNKTDALSLAQDADARVDNTWKCQHPKALEIAGIKVFRK